jgi:hypothetical protein
LSKGDDLRLDRHVERGGRLVGHDQLGLGGQRQRDDDALAHAARELVRVLVDARLRRRDAGLREQVDGALAGLRSASGRWVTDRLHQLLAHGEQRVQRGQRVLEDGADLSPRRRRMASAGRLSMRWPSSGSRRRRCGRAAPAGR